MLAANQLDLYFNATNRHPGDGEMILSKNNKNAYIKKLLILATPKTTPVQYYFAIAYLQTTSIFIYFVSVSVMGFHESTIMHNNNNNNNNSYIALYPVKIYKLAALYIINIKIRLTIKNTINAYINIKLTTTKKARLKPN